MRLVVRAAASNQKCSSAVSRVSLRSLWSSS